MNKYIVNYSQTNDLQIEVEAKDKEEARELADNILETKTFEENVENSQKGYFECWAVDENNEE